MGCLPFDMFGSKSQGGSTLIPLALKLRRCGCSAVLHTSYR